MRAVHLVNYNPDNWEWPDYQRHVASTRAGAVVKEEWSVAQRKNGISVGDDVFLLRQGRTPRGLLGRGIITSVPEERLHWADPTRTAQFVDIDWAQLLPLEEPTGIDELESAVPDFGWRQVYSSGRTVMAPSDLAVLALWEERVDTRGASSDLYSEGSPVSSTTRRYERSSAARARCIELHGHVCSVCAFDFEMTYGSLGKGYIHVHHVVPLATRGHVHSVDPARDLIPVCANCHVMLHKSRSSADPKRIMTPDELIDTLRNT